MQVNPASSVTVRGTDPPESRRVSRTPADKAVFRAVDRVDQALEQTPEVRPEVVARGRELVSSVKYPPTELIDGLSNLLARNAARADE